MSKRDRLGSGSPPNKKSKDKASGENELCITCSKQVKERGIECECCFKWEHQDCAGISDDEYTIISDPSPNIMFFCTVCRPKVGLALKFFNEIEAKQRSLDEKMNQLEMRLNSVVSSNEKVNQLEQMVNSVVSSINMSTITQEPDKLISTDNVNASNSIVAAVSHNAAQSTAAPPLAPPMPPPSVSDKRYNVVVFGLSESPPDTPRPERQKQDLSKLLEVLSSIDSSLTNASIQDFHRLGKFKPNSRPRPLLVKFLRTFEASLVLSKKESLSFPLSIKRDMSLEERTVENLLLKERRNLIDH